MREFSQKNKDSTINNVGEENELPLLSSQ